jgi:ectoine hydroxylase-related dioxygenase (phytanoyl-CoA dioxygenase family)
MSLPDLSSPYPLSAEQAHAYRRDGHILLRQVVTADELAPYRDAITTRTNEFAKSYKPLEERDTYGKAFIQLSNLWETYDDVRRFVFARRFAQIAADLMGVDGVRLYHDQALYKEAGGGHTPWHQDQQYWPLGAYRCTTLWMPLVDASADMGTMRFASGSHRLGYLGPEGISDHSEERFDALVRAMRFPLTYAGDMAAGDVTFHDGYTLHGAPGNASADRTREVMTIIYVEDGAKICPPDSPARVNDLKRWFPGLGPGDLAASALNPKLA